MVSSQTRFPLLQEENLPALQEISCQAGMAWAGEKTIDRFLPQGLRGKGLREAVIWIQTEYLERVIGNQQTTPKGLLLLIFGADILILDG
jgi:hypothetical protein